MAKHRPRYADCKDPSTCLKVHDLKPIPDKYQTSQLQTTPSPHLTIPSSSQFAILPNTEDVTMTTNQCQGKGSEHLNCAERRSEASHTTESKDSNTKGKSIPDARLDQIDPVDPMPRDSVG